MKVSPEFDCDPGNKQTPLVAMESSQGSLYRSALVWRRALFKIKVQRVLKKFKDEILLYGTSSSLLDLNNTYKLNVAEIFLKKVEKQETFRRSGSSEVPVRRLWYLVYPDSLLLNTWSFLLAFALLYTAFVMPYRMAFSESVFWDLGTILEVLIDLLFCVDVLMNLFTTHSKSENTVESSLKKVMQKYLTSWFVFDLVACIPFSLIDYSVGPAEDLGSSSNYNTLLKLFRLPRLYKLLKIVRVLKLLRHYRNSEFLESLQDFLRINSRSYKLVKFLLSIALCVHISGCFWFYAARIERFSPESWVVRHDFLNSSEFTQYLAAIYWAFTTITTVGYGDIYARTEIEVIITVFWMIAGVAFYSMVIGSLTSVLSEIDASESLLNRKMASIQELARETGLSSDCKKRIRQVVKYNHSKATALAEEKTSLFKEMPKTLRYEVALTMFRGIAQEVPFFKGKATAFVGEIMPLFQPTQCAESEFVYQEKDYAAEVFIITKGRVNLVFTESEIAYKSYLKGSYFGDIEILLKFERRLETAQACGALELIAIDRKCLLSTLEDFPHVQSEMLKIAEEKLARNTQEKRTLRESLQHAHRRGTLDTATARSTRLETLEEEWEDKRTTETQKDSQVSLKLVLQRLKRLTDTLQQLQGQLRGLDSNKQ